MNNTLSITEARKKLPELVELADSIAKKTYVTVQGKVKAVVMSPEELESLEATIEVLSDPRAMAAIKKGEKDIKEGQTIPWEDIKKELDL